MVQTLYSNSYITKLKKDIDMNIFLVIKNIEYYNLLNFYVFLFVIFGEKIIYKKSHFFVDA